MFRDEYLWSESAAAVVATTTLLIRGQGSAEREVAFLNEWKQAHPSIAVLTVRFTSLDLCELSWAPADGSQPAIDRAGPVRKVLRELLREKFESLAGVVLDITSLQHSAMMYLVKVLVELSAPGRLFAVYAEPQEYVLRPETGYGLSNGFQGIRAVPGFVRPQKGNDETLVAFLGFEGERVSQLIEERETVSRLVPVIGLPAYQPGWNVLSLASAGRAVLSYGAHEGLRTCAACSISEAFGLLESLHSAEPMKPLVVAPLGTRPHTLATALFAVRTPRAQVLFDHPIEAVGRSKGVGRMHLYHLTGLLP